jgi:hypothetical protein
MKPKIHTAEEYLTWHSEAAGDVHPGLQIISLDKAREFSRLDKIEELTALVKEMEDKKNQMIIDFGTVCAKEIYELQWCISILNNRISELKK